ncbi:hypothetical protein ACO9S2_06425 [Nitrospira sp. NS4]|uniref:hypothetical protein n=1 Tax=Nitrospira sp. NS4 TaxID=3414498 RepID=UPI003C2C5FBB
MPNIRQEKQEKCGQYSVADSATSRQLQENGCINTMNAADHSELSRESEQKRNAYRKDLNERQGILHPANHPD